MSFLKGLRFQKRISILPGVRVNLSKSGVSGSLGPRGADVNIGRHGVTTSAGIPGTGVSYRSKLGSKGSGLGILAVVAGLGLWGAKHLDKIEHLFAPKPATTQAAPASAGVAAAPAAPNEVSTSTRFVHRGGSVLREKAKTSGKTLKKELKGAQVTLVQDMGDGWSKVTDGNITGYMRSSVLGSDPPK